MHGDARSRRIAVVPDSVVNPPPDSLDHLATLAAQGWGVIALAPANACASAKAEWRAAILDQVVTFLDDGYEVVCVHGDDEEMRLFHAALDAAGRRLSRTISFGANVPQELVSE